MTGALGGTLWSFGAGIAAWQRVSTRAACHSMAAVAEGAVQALESAARLVRPTTAAGIVPWEWAGLRRITHQIVTGSETNLRAGFDSAERLVASTGPRDFRALQAAYIQDQSRRTAQQMMDLQRVASEVTLRSAAATAFSASQREAGAPGAARALSAEGDAGSAQESVAIPFRRGRTRGHAPARLDVDQIRIVADWLSGSR